MTSISYAQISIGTNAPHPSAVLDLSSSKKGLLVPRINAITDMTTTATSNGLMIYDRTLQCIRFFQNGAWSDCFTSTAPVITVDCVDSAFSGLYYNGVAMTASNKFSVSVTNTSFIQATIVLQPSDLVLSGVAGVSVVSVSVPSVTLSAGVSQVVEYTLSGSPTATGTLTGTWKKLNLTCVKAATVGNPPIKALNCAGASHNGTLQEGTLASGVSSTIPYANGNGSPYSGQMVTSTGITGLTATLTAGNFATGSGALSYTITGTPSGNGEAYFDINIAGQSCTLTRMVEPSIVPATITLAKDRLFFVLSVYDEDYLPFTLPAAAATTNIQAPDGTREPITANIQGTITTAGVTVRIPVTATASGTLPAYSNTITIPANMTQDGVSRDIKFSWASQVYTTATKFITATIAAVGGTVNAKQVDINAGLGNDGLGVVLGQFRYPYDNTMNTTTYTVRVFPGIPDKMFGQVDNSGNRFSHLMLYFPLYGEDGKLWLSNRLGAHYTNIQNAAFEPTKQASSATDHLAYGSLFQWGRKPDGHELITYTNSTTATAVNGATTSLINNPANALFIYNSFNPYDWRVNRDDTLWATQASANNPCPVGFKVPTESELNTLVAAAGITNSATAFSSLLKFALSGWRDYSNGTISRVGTDFDYWTSSVDGIYANSRYIVSSGTNIDVNPRAFGFSVVCVKD
ncbi:FISUMP domain-containing protein [Flavobacterium succinicans]|nr:FISUMP domain-containing protein [Flavobacterium succinicans]